VAEALGYHYERLTALEEHDRDTCLTAPCPGIESWQRLYDAAVALSVDNIDWSDAPNVAPLLMALDKARAAIESAEGRPNAEVAEAPAPDSKSGKPTPAAEEIARLTDECKRGRETVKQMQPLVMDGLRAKGWSRRGQGWHNAKHNTKFYSLDTAIRLQAECDTAIRLQAEWDQA
jgi:hypothetical protein